jgi:hypothetical protein
MHSGATSEQDEAVKGYLRRHLPRITEVDRLGRHAGDLPCTGRMDSAPTACSPPETLATWAHHPSGDACTGPVRAQCAQGRGERSELVEVRGRRDPNRPAQPLLRRAGSSTARHVTSTFRTAGCGPACPVVWQGTAGQLPAAPMPITVPMTEATDSVGTALRASSVLPMQSVWE